jgi:signal transduction histidine kinase
VFENLLVWIAAHQKRIAPLEGMEDDVRIRIAKIGRLVERGLELIEQLKMYTGDAPLEHRRIQLKALIKHTLAQVDSHGSRVRLAADLSIPLPDLYADRDQLQTALMHVLHNAIEATPADGLVQLTIRRTNTNHRQKTRHVPFSGDYVVITVRDRGEGMSRRIRSRIFDPFFVGRKRTNQLGLGLAVSHGIVTAHGGHIQVRSCQGRGSTFSIFLPVHREPPLNRSMNTSLQGASQVHVVYTSTCPA